MRWLALVLVFFLSACSKEPEKTTVRLNPFETTKNFFTSVSAVTVQVAYETGAEPYDDNTAFNGLSIWWLLEENLNALYQGRSNAPVITVPKKLAEFTELAPSGKTSWTVDDILRLAQTHRVASSTATQAYFWVVFLNGTFHDGTNPQPGTIGLSINGTTVLAVFKDVVRGTAAGNGTVVPRYVEQSTLIHEMGHALGLVNNGLPPLTAHEDPAHRAHCNNPNCVMYWSNAGASDLVAFVRRIAASQSVIMFDAQCLKDSREY